MPHPRGLIQRTSKLLIGLLSLGLWCSTPIDNTAAAAEAASPAPAEGAQAYHVLQDRSDRLIAVLPNRLIVVAQELHAAPVVSTQVWVKTGSIYEQEHVGAGLSHFLEHLLSGGSSSTRTEEESNAILGRIGAQVNASTSLDEVRYFINTTSAHADEAIDLLSDWMQHSLITPTEYSRERDVIQREFDMGNGEPGRIFWKLTQQVRYREHPARHPTIGYIDEFLTITRDEIYDFYKRMYVPNNMVFLVVGDIDRKKAVAQVAQLWARSEPRPLPQISLPLESDASGPRSATGTADMDKPRLRLAWPGTRQAAPGDYALDLLSVILGQGESSRLVRKVRDEQRAVNTISAYNLSYSWGEGFFGVDAEIAVPKPAGDKPVEELVKEAVARAKGAIVEEIQRVREGGVTPEELARAKRQVMAHLVYENQTVEAVADRLADEIINTGDPDYFHHYTEAIQQVTAEEIAQAAAKFLGPAREITITLLPQPRGQKLPPLTRPAEEKPAQPAAREKLELDNLALVNRMRQALQADAASATPVEIGPIQRFELDNGLRLLVQRSTLVPAVAIQFYQLGGLLADQPGREGCNNAAAMMLTRGTATRSAQQIARETEDLGALLETQCGNNTSFVRATALSQDWPKVLGLLADVTLHPTFPQEEWNKMRPRLLASIARQSDSWSGELRIKFREAYFGDHPWSQAPLGRAEVVEKLSAQDLADFYHRKINAARSVLVVFGDVDPQEVKAQAQKLLADLPTQAIEPLEIKDPAAPTARILQVQTNKPLAAVQVGLGPTGTRSSPDYPAMQVLSRVLSSFPTGWLDQELRGRGPGLVYVVGAGQNTGLVPGYFSLLFNTQPAAVPEALARSMQVIERAKNTLVDEQTLAHAKASVLTEEFLGKQANADRAADAALNELYGLGLDEPKEFLRHVEQITPVMLQSVAQLNLRNPVTVVLTHEPVPEETLHKAMTPAPTTQPAE